ncbi:hypothetical protein [Shewanella cutis]|uniref:SMODS and SLOG-associating 2TM effector domain-containing protein n=1 Tax=Shewanella cutis TaxID=2766780 RepID=A0ABS9QZA2_9GAMM|nr:hypothetical protein [Shewanella sp. PS-2]MCG9965664.1 hypothetical protein [Shewanella sp. PS-2]
MIFKIKKLFKQTSISERFIFFIAFCFIFLAIKESKIPLPVILLNSDCIKNWLTPWDYSGLLFNVSCGAIATFIFWLFDIFIPRHQGISISRKYLPQWKNYLTQYSQKLDEILKAMGEGEGRVTLGDTSGIHESPNIGVTFNKVPSSGVIHSLDAINAIVTDIRKYEHSLNKDELKLIHELHMELIMYLSFISRESEVDSNKNFNDIKLIRSKVNSFLDTMLFKSEGNEEGNGHSS